MTAPTIAEQIEIVRDLIEQCEKRAAYLSPDSHHGQASIHVNGKHWVGLKAILATLEAQPAMLAVIEAVRGVHEMHGGRGIDSYSWAKLREALTALAALPPAPEETP